ncbi:hypothetical protein C2G38_2223112 [Gigaspora rosea]|uniref:Uncharacterized protein n=1 Tax=Gigaspora rosea TaxID=44941 RepID=A0A397U4V5_9GLOM|nr:hypothetical protein C2G38_2223112 [Gigaspora rosea]
MSAYGHEALGSPENTVLRPLQACYAFDIHNEQPGFSKDTVILPESIGTTELGSEDATSNDDLYKSSRANEPGSEQGKALAETFCNNTTLTTLSYYYLPMNDILENLPTMTTFSEPMFDNQQDVYDSQLQIEHSNFFELSDSSSQSESDKKNSTDMQWSIDLQLERDVLVHVIMDQYGSVYLSGQWKLKKINPDDQFNRDVTVTSL